MFRAQRSYCFEGLNSNTMITRKISFVTTLVFVVLLAVRSSAQDAKCPPLVVPSVSYQYQGQLKSAVGAEVNFFFVPKKCDCSGSFGGLCYLAGSAAAFKSQYYPTAKAFDVAGSYGYRFILFKPEVTAGYTFLKESYGPDFFHIDPALGIDLVAGNLSFGYSFRTEKIGDKAGSFFVRLAVSPFAFGKSRSGRVLTTYSKATKAEIRNLRATF